jgi:SPP1 gp7 family putative phage head morphogenesis protein
LREVAKDGAGHGLAQVGAGGHETLMQAHQRAVDWAEDRAAELVGDIEETTREGVRDLVARALAEGWTNDELAQALLDSGVFAASRAERIARTEVAMADVQGSLIGWQESGVVAGKEWKTGGGPCDECEELDGEVVSLDDDFPDGDPPLHPNCRCDVLPVLAEDEE